MSDQRYPIWGRLGVGAEVWAELTQEERGKGSAVLKRRTFQTVMNALRHCDEKHYGPDPMAATHAAIRALPVSVSECDAFDIRYGHWTYTLAHNDPHRDPWLARGEKPIGLLLVFKNEAERDAALARLLGDPAQEQPK